MAHAVLALFLTLLLFISISAEQLFTIPLTRRPVPAARAFSFIHRPWAANLNSPSSSPLTSSIRLPSNSTVRSYAEQPMYGDIVTLGEYYITLTFGGQPINVQVDTGSSTLAVPLKQCVNCRPFDHRLDLSKAKGTTGYVPCDSDACGKNTCRAFSACSVCSTRTRACCSTLAPDACGFYLRYADKSGASGALVQADVGIAGMTVPLVFGAILTETSEFENDNVDGIFGMAYKSLACNPTCVTPLFDRLVDVGEVKRDIFSICTARNGGTITLGGSDPKYYEGDLQYVPMIQKRTPHFYDIVVSKVTVGGKTVRVPDFADAIVDSGTTVLVLAPRAYFALKEHFQSNYCHVPGLCDDSSTREAVSAEIIKGPKDLLRTGVKEAAAGLTSTWKTRKTEKTWFSPGYCVNLSDRQVQQLPDITIGLANGVKLVLEPDTYMLKYEAKSAFPLERVIYRCLGITFLDGLQNMENNAILGNTVLHKYFVEYDRENSRIGFAPAKNCLESQSRQSESGVNFADVEPKTLSRWAVDGLVFGIIIAGVCIASACAKESRRFAQYRPIPEAN